MLPKMSRSGLFGLSRLDTSKIGVYNI
jgi:hypothetical protein